MVARQIFPCIRCCWPVASISTRQPCAFELCLSFTPILVALALNATICLDWRLWALFTGPVMALTAEISLAFTKLALLLKILSWDLCDCRSFCGAIYRDVMDGSDFMRHHATAFAIDEEEWNKVDGHRPVLKEMLPWFRTIMSADSVYSERVGRPDAMGKRIHAGQSTRELDDRMLLWEKDSQPFTSKAHIHWQYR